MARGKGNKGEYAKLIAVMSIALVIAAVAIPFVQSLYAQYAPDWARQRPTELPEEAEQVDLSIRVIQDLSDTVSSTALEVYVFDSNKNQIDYDASDTTTGLCVFQRPFWEGESIYVQLREAAPNSATYVVYTSPLIQMTVPNGDVNGDAQLPDIVAQVTTTSVATIACRDQGGTSISATATNYLNDTDASINLDIICTTTDCWFGTPAGFVDMQTGYEYLAGIFVVMKFNATQDMLEYDYYFTEGSYFYYIYIYDAFFNDADIYSDGTKTVTIATGSSFDNGGAAGANATLSIDVYDTCRLISGGVNSQSFMNGDSDLDVSAISTLVHE